MTVEDEKPPSELQHFGIPGMHWGHRKPQLPAANIPPQQIAATTQAAHAIRNKVGIETSRVLLDKYGGTAVRLSGKAAVKGSKFLFGGKASTGAGIVFKILGKTAKVSAKVAAKGGKVYLKTAFKLAKYGLGVGR